MRSVPCAKKRGVFTDEKLKKYWDWSPNNRPFGLNFLYVFSFPKRPTLEKLSENNIFEGSVPWLRVDEGRSLSGCLRYPMPTRVLLSVKPRFAEAILAGDKTFEFGRLLFIGRMCALSSFTPRAQPATWSANSRSTKC